MFPVLLSYELPSFVAFLHDRVVIKHTETSSPILGRRVGRGRRLNSQQNMFHLLFKRLNSLFDWCVGHPGISGSILFEEREQTGAEYDVRPAAERRRCVSLLFHPFRWTAMPSLFDQFEVENL